jgi:hypothetical protein
VSVSFSNQAALRLQADAPETPAPASRPATPPRQWRRPTPLGAMALLVAAAHVLIVVVCAVRARLPVPLADHHDWIARTFAPIGPGCLWEPHNAQRIVWARLLAFIDVRFFSGQTFSFLVAPLALAFGAAVAVALTVRRSGGRSAAATVLATLAFATLCEATLASDTAWPAFSVYVFGAGFAALAFVAFERGFDGRGRTVFLVAALACGIGAGFGNAAGLLVWPTLAVSMARRHRTRPAAYAVLAAGFGFALACTFGLGAPVGSAPPVRVADPANLLKAGAYFLEFLALPFNRGRPPRP